MIYEITMAIDRNSNPTSDIDMKDMLTKEVHALQWNLLRYSIHDNGEIGLVVDTQDDDSMDDVIATMQKSIHHLRWNLMNIEVEQPDDDVEGPYVLLTVRDNAPDEIKGVFYKTDAAFAAFRALLLEQFPGTSEEDLDAACENGYEPWGNGFITLLDLSNAPNYIDNEQVILGWWVASRELLNEAAVLLQDFHPEVANKLIDLAQQQPEPQAVDVAVPTLTTVVNTARQLATAARRIDNMHHAKRRIPAEAWSELYHKINDADTILGKCP